MTVFNNTALHSQGYLLKPKMLMVNKQ